MYIYHLKSLKKNPLLTSKKVTEGCLIKDVPPHTIVVGNPAKFLRKI